MIDSCSLLKVDIAITYYILPLNYFNNLTAFAKFHLICLFCDIFEGVGGICR